MHKTSSFTGASALHQLKKLLIIVAENSSKLFSFLNLVFKYTTTQQKDNCSIANDGNSFRREFENYALTGMAISAHLIPIT